MDIGSGIAIAGAWIFATGCAVSKSVTGIGMWVGIAAALIVTFVVTHH